MTHTDLLRQALDALELQEPAVGCPREREHWKRTAMPTIAALRAALAQPAPAAPAVPASIVPKWTDEELAQGRVGIRWVRDDGVYGRPSKDDALAYIESRWPTPAAPAVPAVREPLTDAQIEQLRENTFSVNNPYCPVDSKSMRKAVRAAERAHGITGDSNG